MKRIAVLCLGLALAGVSGAEAQGLTMHMSNGWKFSFAGNVNAFYFYNAGTATPPRNRASFSGINGSLVPTGDRSGIGTGLLPAFATFEASGREGNLDLGVHFGFAPQVEMGNGAASTFGSNGAGAQIDMRQVYLTFGDKSWGTILAGKELGIYQRQNILTDMTLFGAGTGGGGRGTALGRIGFGYLYTDFRGQISYSTPGGKPASFTIGIFEPTRIGVYNITKTPRLEAEFNYVSPGTTKVQFFASGMVQNAEAAARQPNGKDNLTAAGVAGGLAIDIQGFKILGSGFYAKGLGSVFQGDVSSDGTNSNVLGVDASGEGRKTYGYIGQITWTPRNSKVTLGASYGENRAKLTATENTTNSPDILKYNRSIVGMFSYQWTKALRWVTEYTHSEAKNHLGDAKDKSDQFGTGFMLFY